MLSGNAVPACVAGGHGQGMRPRPRTSYPRAPSVCRRRASAGVRSATVQIVRELADEGNPIAKIAFLTRLAEGTVREILAQLPCRGRER